MNTHHEETVINGILNYRKSFTDKWKPYNKKELTKIINILREKMNNELIVDKNNDFKLPPEDITYYNQINDDIVKVLKIEKTKLSEKLNACVDMLDRVLLHIDLDDVNPSLKKQIQELLNKIK